MWKSHLRSSGSLAHICLAVLLTLALSACEIPDPFVASTSAALFLVWCQLLSPRWPR